VWDEASPEAHAVLTSALLPPRGSAGMPRSLPSGIELVENDHISLGARPSGKERDGYLGEGDEVLLRLAHEPSKILEYYVSCRRPRVPPPPGDDTTEGKEREPVVNQL
jgi:hypothetical protein